MAINTVYETEYRDVINKLVELREKRGFSQKDVAQHLGKTQSYISKIEHHQIKIDIIDLKKLAKLYQFNISEIL